MLLRQCLRRKYLIQQHISDPKFNIQFAKSHSEQGGGGTVWSLISYLISHKPHLVKRLRQNKLWKFENNCSHRKTKSQRIIKPQSPNPQSTIQGTGVGTTYRTYLKYLPLQLVTAMTMACDEPLFHVMTCYMCDMMTGTEHRSPPTSSSAHPTPRSAPPPATPGLSNPRDVQSSVRCNMDLK